MFFFARDDQVQNYMPLKFHSGMFVKHVYPKQKQSQNLANYLSAKVWSLPHTQGHVMSRKCELPLGELTFQFGYCIIT